MYDMTHSYVTRQRFLLKSADTRDSFMTMRHIPRIESRHT